MTNESRQQREPQVTVVKVRPHPRRLLAPAVALIFLGGCISFLYAWYPTGQGVWDVIRIITALVAAWACIAWVIYPFLSWQGTVYTLTGDRIVARKGILRKTVHEVPLNGVSDVATDQTITQRFSRSGSLIVKQYGFDTRPVVLTDVPRVAAFKDALFAVRQVMLPNGLSGEGHSGAVLGNHGTLNSMDPMATQVLGNDHSTTSPLWSDRQ